ncbi:MAG TPA: NAD-binding protein, partial [Burkholderiaceae bacterium]
HLLPAPLGQFVFLTVALSMFLTPLAARGGAWIASRMEQANGGKTPIALPAGLDEQGGHVVIAGFGRVGQLLAHILREQGVSYVALDANLEAVAAMRAQGYPVFFGDASHPELLQHLHADKAQAVVLTMDDPASALHTVRALHCHFPDVALFARARDEAHAAALLAAGASNVIPEALEAGLQLSGLLLDQLGYSEDAVEQLLQQQRVSRIGSLRGAPEAPSAADCPPR